MTPDADTTDIVFTAASIKADGDGNATGNGLKLSAIAQAYIKSAGDDLTVTVAEVADSDETVGLASVTDQTVTTTAGDTASLEVALPTTQSLTCRWNRHSC